MTEEVYITGATQLLANMGKTPVMLDRYVPGFIINRLLRALGREAFYLIDNGYITAEQLDMAVKGSIAPRMLALGVMQRYDFTGLDLSAQNFKNDKFVDAPVELAQIGRAHVRTPVTHAQLVSRLLLHKKTLYYT